MKGLYVHIPFCESICHYCDFAKQVPKDNLAIDRYLDVLITELNEYKAHFNTIETIYIGGGTPSMLTLNQLERLLIALLEIKPLEYTIEVNPESYSTEKGLLLKKYNVNRISLGVQTFNQDLLVKLNRKHKIEDVYFAINDLKKIGINNISLDLIYALPSQTINDLRIDLEHVKKLNVNHISCYSLILEDKTYFYHQFLRGKFTPSSQDLEAEMFSLIKNELTKQGFNHYEISNFAKTNYESKHNLIYWTLGEYIGIGQGAHGFFNGIRTYNNRSLNLYLKQTKREEVIQTKEDLLTDELIFGLRKTKGIIISDIEQKYEIKLFEKYLELNDKIEEGLLEIKDGYLKLTDKGIFLGNQVFVVFI